MSLDTVFHASLRGKPILCKGHLASVLQEASSVYILLSICLFPVHADNRRKWQNKILLLSLLLVSVRFESTSGLTARESTEAQKELGGLQRKSFKNFEAGDDLPASHWVQSLQDFKVRHGWGYGLKFYMLIMLWARSANMLQWRIVTGVGWAAVKGNLVVSCLDSVLGDCGGRRGVDGGCCGS